MRTTQRSIYAPLVLFALVTFASAAFAADPGIPIPDSSEISDQKPGSVLIYNLYTSSATAPNSQNTSINITNICSTTVVAHFFFVDGATCSVADAFICLTGNQTISFLASDIDPGVTGYIIAVAVDRSTGCPITSNCLIGHALHRLALSSGPTHNCVLRAEGATSGAGGSSLKFAFCDENSTTAELIFDGATGYSRLPRVLAVDNIPDRASGNDTLVIINRIGGNLATGAAMIGPIIGLLFNDAENAFSFTFTSDRCQFISSLSNSFPRTTPRFETIIPAGHSGWMKFWSLSDDVGLLGAVKNANPNVATAANAFVGGHNLHKLSLATSVTLTIPVFPPSC